MAAGQIVESAGLANAVDYRYIWTIGNFSKYFDTVSYQNYIWSPIFKLNDAYKFSMKLYPNGEDEETVNNVSLYLACFLTNNEDKLRVCFNFMLFNYSNKTWQQVRGIDLSNNLLSNNTTAGYGNFIKKQYILNKKNGLIQNDEIKIFCEIYTSEMNSMKQRLLSKDLHNLLKSKVLTDVTLIVDGKEYHAHKAILAARSSVFSAMFSHNMREKRTNQVQIDDTDHKVFGKLLEFIYTGVEGNIEDVPKELLVAANKYNISALKEICENFLGKTLTIENSIELLVFADLYRTEGLKSEVIKFITSNLHGVMKTSDFNSGKMSAELYKEILIKVGEKLQFH